jgi:hypothetical protein
LAVRLPIQKYLDRRLIVSYMLRHDYRADLDARRIDSRSLIEQGAQDSLFAGHVRIEQNLAEPWFGFSYSIKLSETIGVGVTQFVGIRVQRGRWRTLWQQTEDDQSGGSAIAFEELRYWNVRGVTKFGMYWDHDPITYGIATTLPSFNLFGLGRYTFNTSFADVETIPGYRSDLILASTYQERLDSKYHSPFSLSLGASYHNETTALHFTAEWFNRVGRYQIVRVQPFKSQSSGSLITRTVEHELADVFNVGLGIEHNKNVNVTWYGALTTDFSARLPGSSHLVSITNWDIYHLTFGSAFGYRDYDFTLGSVVSLGFRNNEPLENFSSLSHNGIYEPGVSLAFFWRFKLILGVTLPY